jgi:hypothetical protein
LAKNDKKKYQDKKERVSSLPDTDVVSSMIIAVESKQLLEISSFTPIT